MTAAPSPTGKIETFRDRQDNRHAILDAMQSILDDPNLSYEATEAYADRVADLRDAVRSLESPTSTSELEADGDLFNTEEALRNHAVDEGVKVPEPIECFSRRQIELRVDVEVAEFPIHEIKHAVGAAAEGIAKSIQTRGDQMTDQIEDLYKPEGATPEEEAGLARHVGNHVDFVSSLVEQASKIAPDYVPLEWSNSGPGIDL